MTMNGKTPNTEITIGEQALEKNNTYKYLGISIKGQHGLSDTKDKTEAALHMIFILAGNEKFHNIEMSTIWKLLNTCIIP